MTVAELMKKLSEFPADQRVKIQIGRSDNSFTTSDITEIDQYHIFHKGGESTLSHVAILGYGDY